MNINQDSFLSIQEFRDQYLEMKKVCITLPLHFGRCKDDAWTILKEKGMTNPIEEQLKKQIITMKSCSCTKQIYRIWYCA